MSATTAAGLSRARRGLRRSAPAVAAVLLAVAALARIAGPGAPAAPQLGAASQRYAPAPRSAEIEARWGARFSQVAITAGGGLVDVRYVVLDASRAVALGRSAQTTPMVYDERSHTLLNTPTMAPHAHHLRAGATSFLLLRNTGGAVRRGDRVTIVVGRARLSGVPVL